MICAWIIIIVPLTGENGSSVCSKKPSAFGAMPLAVQSDAPVASNASSASRAVPGSAIRSSPCSSEIVPFNRVPSGAVTCRVQPCRIWKVLFKKPSRSSETAPIAVALSLPTPRRARSPAETVAPRIAFPATMSIEVASLALS